MLIEKIEQDYIVSYKAKDSVKLNVLRLIKTALKNKRVELIRDLTEDEVLEVIAKQAKQRLESIEQFNAGNRPELAEKEEAELIILREYLPQPLSKTELTDLVQKTISEINAQDMKDMGKVISKIMAEYKSQVDGKELSDLVKATLSKQNG